MDNQSYLLQTSRDMSYDHTDDRAAEHEKGPIKLKRGSAACKRCRRLRSKCIHGSPHKAPCEGCVQAGPAEAGSCAFPARGEDSGDRDFRRKRIKNADKPNSASRSPVAAGLGASPGGSLVAARRTGWELLPPIEEVIEGVKAFVSGYFQLGFIPKALFLERLTNDRENISVFLVLSILSISARFTPSLVRRYETGTKATEHFMLLASELVPSELYQPSLQRIQAFFLLAIAEFGHGERTRSAMHMGCSVRMAGILRLHREESFRLEPDASSDEVVAAEVARRTFWMIVSQDSLHSGDLAPSAFSLPDISTLLPCEETDFAFGHPPRHRAALARTAAARTEPALVHTPSRSLFATLIQAHDFWGRVTRCACSEERDLQGSSAGPWERGSAYAEMVAELSAWERALPQRHQWSTNNLRGYKAEGLDLAYLSVTMVNRMSNIVIRRIYLPRIAGAVDRLRWQNDQHDQRDAPPAFWNDMANELFSNVVLLHEQVDAYFPLRRQEEGFPAILLFAVFTCGKMAARLWRYPQLCPYYAPHAQVVLVRALNVLSELSEAWPAALRWLDQLKAAAVWPSPGECDSLTATVGEERAMEVAKGMLHTKDDEERGVLARPQSYASPGAGSSSGGTPKERTPVMQAQGLPASGGNTYPFPAHLQAPRGGMPPPPPPPLDPAGLRAHASYGPLAPPAHAQHMPPPQMANPMPYHHPPSSGSLGPSLNGLYDLATAAAGQHVPVQQAQSQAQVQVGGSTGRVDSPYDPHQASLSLAAQLTAHGIVPPLPQEQGGQAQGQEHGRVHAQLSDVPFFLEDSFSQELASFIQGTTGVGGEFGGAWEWQGMH